MASNTLAKHPSGQFQITFTIPFAEISKAYQTSLEELAKDIEVPGFRKGKAPLPKVEASIDKNRVYDRAIQQIIPQLYTAAVQEHQLKPILTPDVRLIKAQENEDWQIEAISTELPQADVTQALAKIKGLIKASPIWTPEKGGDKDATQEAPDTDPETQRNQQLQQIIDFLLKEVVLEVPPILVTQETNRLLSNLIGQLEKLGVNLDQYLQSVNKTGDQLRQEYTLRAAEDLKIEFTLAQISNDLKVDLSEAEVNQFIDTAPDEQTKQNLRQPQMLNQIRAMLIKRKTLDELLKLAQ